MHKAFEVHILNEDGKRRARDIALAFDELLTRLNSHMSDGREKAIVITKLEEAAFFAKKAMAVVPTNLEANGLAP